MNNKDKERTRNRKRKILINFRVDEDELKFIKAKMLAANVTNREAFIRKLVIDGKLVIKDYKNFETEMRKANYLIGNVATSLNQIAKRINSTGNYYHEDYESIKSEVENLKKMQIEIMKCFRKKIEED